MQIPFTLTTHDMKKHNILRIVESLKFSGMATKAQLASQTGLSVATCGTVLNTLCNRNQVRVHQLEVSRGGRPAQCFACNPDFYSHLALYVEGSNDAARIIWSVNSATGDRLAQGEYDFQPLTLETFECQISNIMNQHPDIKAAGIGFPGVVSEGKVITCQISLFENIDIIGLLQKKYGLFVQADNEMNYTAWGFYRSGISEIQAPVAYIHLPRIGFAGCGIVVNNVVLRGASNFAGEMDYLTEDSGDIQSLEKYLAMILTTVITIINPAKIAVSGPILNAEILANAVAISKLRIPKRHIPVTVFRHTRREDYLLGIAEQVAQAYLHHQIFCD